MEMVVVQAMMLFACGSSREELEQSVVPRYPTFLNAMYSSHLFGHKQIFSTTEMRKLFEAVEMEVIDLHKFHELSFPYEFYLRKLFKSEAIVRLLLPAVRIFFRIFKIQNKMLVVGRKT